MKAATPGQSCRVTTADILTWPTGHTCPTCCTGHIGPTVVCPARPLPEAVEKSQAGSTAPKASTPSAVAAAIFQALRMALGRSEPVDEFRGRTQSLTEHRR